MKHLKELQNQNIVSFQILDGENEIEIEEECDRFFRLIYSKKEFGELIQELQDIHDKMK